MCNKKKGTINSPLILMVTFCFCISKKARVICLPLSLPNIIKLNIVTFANSIQQLAALYRDACSHTLPFFFPISGGLRKKF